MVTCEYAGNDSVVLSNDNTTVVVIPGNVSITRGNGLADSINGNIVTLLVEPTELPNVVLGEIRVNDTIYSIKEYIVSFGKTTDGETILANFVKFASKKSKVGKGE